MNRPLSLVVSFFAFAASAVIAQDPSFRPAQPQRLPAPAPAPAPAPSGGSEVTPGAALMSSMDRLDSSYQLGIGDKLSLRIVEEGEKLHTLRVLDSGNIIVPLIDLVPAVGRTCKDVAFAIKRELEKGHFRVATVILALDEKAPVKKAPPGQDMMGVPGFITIYGQVARQGRYEVDPREDLTVSQAILRAGGFSQFAKDKRVKLIRNYPGKGNVEIWVNLQNVMLQGMLQYDLPVRGGDVVIVGEKKINF